jgi:anti-sigma factor ChrR (cupin superfamily)
MSAGPGTAAVRAALALEQTIATALDALPVGQERRHRLRNDLLERVRHSARAHRLFKTIRREDTTWTTIGPGVRRCPLSSQAGLRVDLLKLAPGIELPWVEASLAQEVLVVDGALSMPGAMASAPDMTPARHLVLGRSAANRPVSGRQGATLYVRSRTAALDQLPCGEACWWARATRESMQDAGTTCRWEPFMDGVDAAALQVHDGVASMLIRVAPGAALPDHGHSQEEDCYMLEGDMFLGDILMRAGDYQLAPVGRDHVGISSDAGALFYFHGALPPAASGDSR